MPGDNPGPFNNCTISWSLDLSFYANSYFGPFKAGEFIHGNKLPWRKNDMEGDIPGT